MVRIKRKTIARRVQRQGDIMRARNTRKRMKKVSRRGN